MADKKHFFISRAGEDAEFGKWVAATLRVAGYETTLEDDDFRPGHNVFEEMNKALEIADHVLAVFSPHYVRRIWTRTELWAALNGDGLGKKRRLIPIKIDECQVPPLVGPIVFVDLVGKDEAKKREMLLDAVRPDSLGTPTHRISISKLPAVDPTLLGREKELAFLDQA